MGKIAKTSIYAVAFLMLLCMPCLAAGKSVSNTDGFSVRKYDPKQEIKLDADSVRYNEETGLVEADGNVFIRNWQLSLSAPHVKYDTGTQQLTALSDSSGNVVVASKNEKLSGKNLVYNLSTRKGLFTNVTGNSGAMRINGENIKLMPAEEAVKHKIIKKKLVSRKSIETKGMIAEWRSVSATSCDFAKPHYKLKTKSAVIIPGQKMVLKNPGLYFGDHLVFKYPFDYVAKFGKRSSIMPTLDYSSEKGTGFGIQGPLDFGKQGMLDTKFVYWTNDLFEVDFNYEREFLLNGLSIYGRISREYNKDDKDIQWRPQWGFKYAKNGWDGRLYFSDRELVTTEMIPGVTHRYNVTKKPETYVNTPWLFEKYKLAKLRLGMIYGRYSDDSTADWINRFGAKAELRDNFDDVKLMHWLRPIYGARYYYYKYYDEAGETQKVADVWAGFRYNIGSFDLTTRYYQRWVNGRSPLEFDQYRDNKLIFQSVAFPLPFGNKINKWTISAATEYDLDYSRFAVLYYTLSYSKHCYTWMIWGKKEFFGTESELGLTFYINAFPDKQLHIGSNLDDEERRLMEGEH